MVFVMLSKTFEGRRESLPVIRKWMRDALNGLVSQETLDHSLIIISTGEVLQNVIRYGFEGNEATGSISVSLHPIPYGLGIDIEDTAPSSDPSTWISEKDASEGGLGLITVKNAASAVTFAPTDFGNRARLIFLENQYGLSRESAAWIGDIYLCRQKPCNLVERMCMTIGVSVEPWQRDLFEKSSAEVLSHIIAYQDRLHYHNEWHIQDVLISVDHLLRNQIVKLTTQQSLELILAALFHDHLHPGAAKLADLDEPIEFVSARQCGKFLESWLAENGKSGAFSIAVIEQLILSTLPENRIELSAEGASHSNELPFYQRLEMLVNDADVMASFIPELGTSLARAMKFESLNISTSSTNLYSSFRGNYELKAQVSRRLLNNLV